MYIIVLLCKLNVILQERGGIDMKKVLSIILLGFLISSCGGSTNDESVTDVHDSVQPTQPDDVSTQTLQVSNKIARWNEAKFNQSKFQ